MPETTLITGASSGLGAALALARAQPGATLHLSGRSQSRLDTVASACRAKGATVHTTTISVTDRDAMAAWIEAAGPLHLVIANAGISAGLGRSSTEPPAQARAIFATNLDGMLNTVFPALDVMAAQPPGPDGKRGRIAVIASISAFMPLPTAPCYGASKAAVDSFTAASIPSATALGIGLTSVCPGYIQTNMTAHNRFPMPGLMSAERAAAIILRGLARDKKRIVFPWWMGLAARLAGLLPLGLVAAAAAQLPAKHALPDPQ